MINNVHNMWNAMETLLMNDNNVHLPTWWNAMEPLCKHP